MGKRVDNLVVDEEFRQEQIELSLERIKKLEKELSSTIRSWRTIIPKNGALAKEYEFVGEEKKALQCYLNIIKVFKTNTKNYRELHKKKEALALHNHWYNANLKLAPHSFRHFLLCMEWNYPEDMTFFANRYHVMKDWAIALENLELGKLDGLGISAPPRSGKTAIGTLFLAWVIGRHPDKSCFFASHTNAMAVKVYTDIINLITDDRRGYLKIFPDVRYEKSAEYLWIDFTNKYNPNIYKTIYFRGIDGNMAGVLEASHLIYCDDLIRGIEEALNPSRLENAWQKYTTDISQRRTDSNVKELHIATRWSINDVLSKLEDENEDNDRWEFIKVPGLNENGESNFNFKYRPLDKKHFEKLKTGMDEVSFECIVQQNPIERDGLLLPKSSLNYYEGVLPEGEPDGIYFACDVAWGGKDYLSMPIGYLYGTDCYIHDVVHKSAPKETTKPAVASKIVEHKCTRGHFEANNGGDEYSDDISDRVKEKGHRCAISHKKAPSNKSKLDRILDAQSEIKGLIQDGTGYRLIFLSEKARKGNADYEMYMKHLTGFNQSQKFQGKQFDDAADSTASLVTNVLTGGRSGKVSFYSRNAFGL